MKENLVILKGQKILCDSRVIADKFEKKHAYVIRCIQNLITDFNNIKGDPKPPLIMKKESKYRGQTYIYYEMDKKFFTHLTMRLKGNKAFEWQIKFVDAFFQMEQALVRKSNLEWKQDREQGKQIRIGLTNEIKTFIEYAIQQGSKNANKYYITITKMEYKALQLIEKNEKINKDFSNTLDLMDLNHLLAAENVARKALVDGMNQKLHYKDIFQLAKQNVIQLANIIVIKTIPQIQIEQETT